MTDTPIPILLYHAVNDAPPEWLAPWSVTPRQFAAHLDAIVVARCTALTVSELVRSTSGGTPLPRRPVVITFDDGFADFAAQAVPALNQRGLVSTLYVTTGALRGDGPHVPSGPATRALRACHQRPCWHGPSLATSRIWVWRSERTLTPTPSSTPCR